MVELVRDLRSAVGYGSKNLKHFLLIVDLQSLRLLKDEGPYDYVFNLSALSMLSESDPYNLCRSW